MADWITEEEFCKWLKVKRITAYRWRKEGMPFIGKKGSVRYNKEEVENWLKERNANK